MFHANVRHCHLCLHLFFMIFDLNQPFRNICNRRPLFLWNTFSSYLKRKQHFLLLFFLPEWSLLISLCWLFSHCWLWPESFSSLSAVIHGIKYHLCARYFHINVPGPDLFLEHQTHTYSCLFDILHLHMDVYSAYLLFLFLSEFREFIPCKSCEKLVLIWEI